MAYWTVTFKTFSDRTIYIMIDKPAGNDVALIPSANPCTISEEGREDLFVPIKTQSGYIEVITDDITLAEQIIPSRGGTRRVLIYETATPTSYTEPIWVGYVQPQLLTFQMWDGKQSLKIPIECQLSAMKYKNANLSSSILSSIGSILNKILPWCDRVYFQGGVVVERNNTTADRPRAWLRKQIYTSLFDNEATQYDVLEKICTFFGWTCRAYGSSLYFISNRNVDAAETTVRYLDRTGLATSAYYSYAATWQEVMLAASMISSNINKVKFTEGCRLAKATCQLDTFDQSANIDYTQIGIAIDNQSINPTQTHYHNEWSEAGHDYVRDREYYDSFSSVNIGDFNVNGSNVKPVLEKNESTDATEWNTTMVVKYSSDYTTDTFWVESQDPESPPYEQTNVQIHSQYFGYLVFTSVNTIVYDRKGILKIKLSFDTENYSKYSKACLILRIGDKFYNPVTSEWQSLQPSSYIAIETDNNEGYDVVIPESMSGIMTLRFVPDTDYINHYNLTELAYGLTSISVEYISDQSETYNSQISNVEHSAKNGDGFSKTVSFDSSICIRGTLTANSKNFLLDNDGNVSAGLYDTPYSDAQLFSPLQRLCDQAAAEMSAIGQMYELKARWRGGLIHNITPITMIYIASLNAWAYPVGCEYNLRDDEVRLRLLKRNYSEGNQ